MDSEGRRVVVSREEWHATVAAGIRVDVEKRLRHLEQEVLDGEPLHPDARAYVEEQVAVWRGRLETQGGDDWWRTQVDVRGIAGHWPDLDRLLHEGYSREEAEVWLTADGIDDPVEVALEWRGFTPKEAVAWRRAVASRREAERWLSRGWTSVQVTLVWVTLGIQVRGTGDPDGQPLLEEADAQGELMDAWAASGIPAHRVVLYTRLGIPLDEAVAQETSGESEEALDGALSTLAALTKESPDG